MTELAAPYLENILRRFPLRLRPATPSEKCEMAELDELSAQLDADHARAMKRIDDEVAEIHRKKRFASDD